MGDIFIYLLVALSLMIAYYFIDRNVLFALAVGAVGSVVGVGYYFGAMTLAATSLEVWNGQITDKERVYDPETESYDCGKDSQGNTRTCTRTIPRWRFDVESNVDSTYYEYSYNKHDVPEIYANAKVGAPFAATHMFMNYQYVSDQQIHVNKLDSYDGWLPEYPEIYNGFQINHAFSNVVNMNNLDAMLSWAHKSWGPKYGVNVIVCVVSDTARGFSGALRNKWVGGKKNDAVVTIYVDAQENVKNVEVFSRSTQTKRNDMQADFNIALRESVASLKTYDFEGIVNAIGKTLPLFEREDLSQYDYLSTDYEAPSWVKAIGVVLVFATCFGFATWLGRRGGNAYLFTRHKRHGRRFS